MAINRAPTNDVEYFDSAKEVSLEDDRVETDIHVIGWSKKFRIRALSFEQMERINKLATIQETDKDKGRIAGKLDQAEWVYWTIKEGVVRPFFSIAQARELSENNGSFVRELAEEIWNLGRISKRQWDAYITEQSKLIALQESDNPDADESA